MHFQIGSTERHLVFWNYLFVNNIKKWGIHLFACVYTTFHLGISEELDSRSFIKPQLDPFNVLSVD